MDLVSIVIPCYNAGKNIIQAIKSVLEQTHTNIEIIIVNDGSTDNSKKILDGINNPKVIVIHKEINMGYPTAMKLACSIAHGKYIARMDADDIIHPTKIEQQVNCLKNNPNCAFVSCHRYRITPYGKKYTFKNEIKKSNKYYKVTHKDLMESNRFFVDAGTLFEKSKYDRAGGYRDYQRSGMDVDLWLRLLENFNYGLVLPDLLYGHRMSPNSIVFSAQTPILNQIPRKLANLRNAKNLSENADLAFIPGIIAELNKNIQNNQNFTQNNSLAAISLYLKDFRSFWSFYRTTLKNSSFYNKFLSLYYIFIILVDIVKSKKIIKLEKI